MSAAVLGARECKYTALTELVTGRFGSGNKLAPTLSLLLAVSAVNKMKWSSGIGGVVSAWVEREGLSKEVRSK